MPAHAESYSVIDLPNGQKGIRRTQTADYTLDEFLLINGQVFQFAQSMGSVPQQKVIGRD